MEKIQDTLHIKQIEMMDYLISCSVGSKLCKRLFSWTTNANQQCMTTVHSDDAVNDGQVFQSIIKKHQVHPGLIFIILLQDLLQGSEKKSVIITNNKSFTLPSLFVFRYTNDFLLWKGCLQVMHELKKIINSLNAMYASLDKIICQVHECKCK